MMGSGFDGDLLEVRPPVAGMQKSRFLYKGQFFQKIESILL
jgi:hypothetical protein